MARKPREKINNLDTLKIGGIYKSNSYGDFTITGEYKVPKTCKGKQIGLATRYRVKFLQTGYESDAARSAVACGAVRDPYYPVILGIACLGNAQVVTPYEKYMYNTWQNMLRRCYDVTRHNYASYGGRGCTVHQDWLCFENFLRDIPTLAGYDADMILQGKLVLDKDEHSIEMKQYSKSSCQWVSPEKNASMRCTDTYAKHYNIYDSDNKLIQSLPGMQYQHYTNIFI